MKVPLISKLLLLTLIAIVCTIILKVDSFRQRLDIYSFGYFNCKIITVYDSEFVSCQKNRNILANAWVYDANNKIIGFIGRDGYFYPDSLPMSSDKPVFVHLGIALGLWGLLVFSILLWVIIAWHWYPCKDNQDSRGIADDKP